MINPQTINPRTHDPRMGRETADDATDDAPPVDAVAEAAAAARREKLAANPTLAAVVAQLDAAGWPSTHPLSGAQVREWLRSDDLEVLGALHRLLDHDAHLQRISPPLAFSEFSEFKMRYLQRCLCQGDAWLAREWANAPLDAANAAADWFVTLWNDKRIVRSDLATLKDWLAYVCKNCRHGVVLSIAITDHLFCYRKVRDYFLDWQDDPVLHILFR